MNGPTLPPDSGNYERSLLGYLAFALVEDILPVSRRLMPEDMQHNLHRALYKRIVQAARQGKAITEMLDTLTDMDPWLSCDIQGITPRKYLAFAREVAAESPAQLDSCIERIQECAARRRRYHAALRMADLACDERKSVAQVDAETNTLLRRAREQPGQEKQFAAKVGSAASEVWLATTQGMSDEELAALTKKSFRDVLAPEKTNRVP